MSAIKNYFNYHREQKVLREQRRKEMILQKKKEYLERIELEKKQLEEEFLEADSNFRMEYLVDADHIINYSWELREEVFKRIMDNIETYPEFVRQVLTQAFNPTPLSNGKIKLVELTDEHMEQIEIQKEKEFDDKFEEEWQKYKQEIGLTRPESSVDEKYTELYEKLQDMKKKLEDEQKKPSEKKYVPIHLRGKEPTIPAEVEKIQKTISEIENEIVKVKKEIQQEEHNWENERRRENKTKIINKMFEV
jgi:hypothetical protein